MSTFRYDAVRADGHRVLGRLDATTRAEAASALSRRGLLAVAVEPLAEHSREARRPPVRSLATIFRSLASLTSAGVPLRAALRTSRTIAFGPLREALGRVEARIAEGEMLSRALEREPGTFPPVSVGLVRAGERGAGLDLALARAATDLENRAETAGRVRAALAYPIILAAVGGTSLVAILLFVVPKFATLLADVHAALPLATRALLAASAVLRSHLILIGAGLAATGGALAWIAHSHRHRWHSWLLAAPLVGPVRHALASARGARTLAALLASGSPTLGALRVTAETIGDGAVAGRLSRAAERVGQGESLSHALSAESAFTPLVLQMATIGDGVGRVPELLNRAGDLEEEVTTQRIRGAVALVEPLAVVVFAGAIALVAASLLQAIYSVRPSVP